MAIDSPLESAPTSPRRERPGTPEQDLQKDPENDSEEEVNYYPALSGCRSVDDFEKLNKVSGFGGAHDGRDAQWTRVLVAECTTSVR